MPELPRHASAVYRSKYPKPTADHRSILARFPFQPQPDGGRNLRLGKWLTSVVPG